MTDDLEQRIPIASYFSDSMDEIVKRHEWSRSSFLAYDVPFLFESDWSLKISSLLPSDQ